MLPYVRTLTFEISTTTDLHYAADLFASSRLPDLFNAVAKIRAAIIHVPSVEYPGFY
jgi:hypothetical protein